MKENVPYYWCPKCKKLAIEIVEKYDKPLQEQRKWSNNCYVLTDSNITESDYAVYCAECDTKLVEVTNDEELKRQVKKSNRKVTEKQWEGI